MKTNMLVMVSLSASLVGCVQSAEDEGTADESTELEAGGKADGVTWSKILTCENGSVVVDVDVNERRNVQVVVRHWDAINHLRAMATANNWASSTILEPNSKGEVILRGTSNRGVFHPSDFESMTRDTNYAPVYTARREWGGLKVALLGVHRLSQPSCRWVDENQGNWVCEEYGFGEFADWWFSGCSEP